MAGPPVGRPSEADDAIIVPPQEGTAQATRGSQGASIDLSKSSHLRFGSFRFRVTKEHRESNDDWNNVEQEMKERAKNHSNSHTTGFALLALAWGSLGVIYGDIGTSVLYVFSSTIHAPPSNADVLGVMSLLFWTMTLIVLVKYVLVVLRADDNGEGGTFAMYSLLCRSLGITPFGTDNSNIERSSSHLPEGHGLGIFRPVMGKCLSNHGINQAVRKAFRSSRPLQAALLLTVVLATAMMVGDGILTPSISVLSAVSGLKVATTAVPQGGIIGITVAILILLFLPQRYGTQLVGHAFAPIIAVWLVFNASVGIYNLHRYGGYVLSSINPAHIFDFFLRNDLEGWQMLGGVMLCITGAEAMYADLGHFNRRAVAAGFSAFVYPCLMLTYFGQAAHLLHHPEDIAETFWQSTPDSVFWPMFVMAILASIVASQALISGCYSIIRQAMMLGLFPKMTVLHTGKDVEGQIYMPEVNYGLMLLCIAVTVGFQSTEQLGQAYGVTVMSTMVITTLLIGLVMIVSWDMHPIFALIFVAFYLPFEGAFLSATLVKVPSGGWVALLIAAITSIIKLTWWYGTSIKNKHELSNKQKLTQLLAEVPVRTPPCSCGRGNDGSSGGAPGAGAAAAAAGAAGAAEGADLRTRPALQGRKTVTLKRIGLNPSSTGQELAIGGISAGNLARPVGSTPAEDLATQPTQLCLLENLVPVARIPGMGLYYSDTVNGVPAVLAHVLRCMPAMYDVAVFLTVRFVPVPQVTQAERFLVRKMCDIKHCYHVVVRYGYMEEVHHGEAFVRDLVQVIVQYCLRPHHSIRPCMDDILASAPAAITTDRTAGTQEGKQRDLIAAVAAPSTPRAAAAIAAATDAGNVAVSVVISPNNSRHTQKDRDEAEKQGDAAVIAAAAGNAAADGAAEQPGVTLEQAEDVVNPLTTFPTTRKGSVSTLNHAAVGDSKRWCKPLSHLEDQALFMQRVKTLIKAQLGSSGDAAFVVAAYHKRWVYTLGRTTIKPSKNARILDKVVLGWFYKMLADNSKQQMDAWHIPTQNLIELGMDIQV